MKHLRLILGAVLALAGSSALATPSRDSLARDVERAESVRAVKTLEYTYAQYAQFGLWNEMGALFAAQGVMDAGEDHARGARATPAFPTRRYGAGRQGLAKGEVHTLLIASPVVNLSVDGTNAKA